MGCIKENSHRLCASHPSRINRQLYSPKLCRFSIYKIWSWFKPMHINRDALHCSDLWLFMHNRASWPIGPKNIDCCFCDWISIRLFNISSLFAFGRKWSRYPLQVYRSSFLSALLVSLLFVIFIQSNCCHIRFVPDIKILTIEKFLLICHKFITW